MTNNSSENKTSSFQEKLRERAKKNVKKFAEIREALFAAYVKEMGRGGILACEGNTRYYMVEPDIDFKSVVPNPIPILTQDYFDNYAKKWAELTSIPASKAIILYEPTAGIYIRSRDEV